MGNLAWKKGAESCGVFKDHIYKRKCSENCSFILINKAVFITSPLFHFLLWGERKKTFFSFFHPTWFFTSITARHYASV